ncbi:hypothetical protein H257_14699 [Aphanomyces astaci]|uniref:Uncharacterized protein n=1 Tax=Aphanomyces astaci TaxID=112090 RepID=W4FQC8_APHAT|nr:hypothetical protein H257_14699 [Aphanomyces astaci]ETV69680.1 hypothetical protein H257_14699 [Aphanomyces astaci]|eukprot:XP_009840896.1 hypothetical protein H257_14699 [Aphanomyces astaci]
MSSQEATATETAHRELSMNTHEAGRITRRHYPFGRDLVRHLEEASSPALPVGAIVGIALGVVVVGFVVYNCIRRLRLENRRKKTQMQMDRALLEGAQQDPTMLMDDPSHLYPPPSSSTTPKIPKRPDIGIVQTPIEHVVGSTGSDDFVIMGNNGKPPPIPRLPKANKVGVHHVTAPPAYIHPSSTKPLPAPGSHAESSFAASCISDDIAMLQSSRGGSFDSEVVEHTKPRAV